MFRVGNRIRAIVDHPEGNHHIHEGDTGVVLASNSNYTKVRWDHDVHGHDCDGLCEDGYGWNVYNSTIELDREETLVFMEEDFSELMG